MPEFEGLGERFDVRMEGVPFRIKYSSYQTTDIVDFSPRGATPGGSQAFSDLQIYQPLTQEDWSHGFGFIRQTDIQGYMRTEGNIDARHLGYAMLFTQATLSKTFSGATVNEGGFIFDDKFYVWGSNGLWRLDTPGSDTWTQVYASALNFAMANGTFVFVFPEGARPERSSSGDAASWSDAGADTAAIDFAEGVYHNGFYFAIEEDTHYVHKASETDLSDLEGDGENDADVIIVGGGAFPVLKLWPHGGKLWAFTHAGTFEIGEDFRARMKVNKEDELSANNFRDVNAFQGDVYYPVQDQLFGWNGSAEVKATPPALNDEWPFTTYGEFDNFVSRGDFFYCTGKTNESTYEIHLLCYDGGHWFKLTDLVTNGTDNVTMLALDVQNLRLWYHIEGASDDTLHYIPLQDLSEFPYADFPTGGGNKLVFSRMDMGYRRIVKSSPSVIVSGQNVNESGRDITIEYSLDGDDYVELGSLQEDGSKELFFQTEKGTVEYHNIILRADLDTDDSAQTPVLEDLTLRFLMRPKTLYGWVFDVIAENFAATPDGVSEMNQRARDVVRKIKELRDQAAPVDFQDIDGIEYQTYITAINKRISQRDVDNYEEGAPVFQYLIRVNMVQVGGVVAEVTG